MIIFYIDGLVTIVERTAKSNFLLFLSFQLSEIGNQNFVVQFFIEQYLGNMLVPIIIVITLNKSMYNALFLTYIISQAHTIQG